MFKLRHSPELNQEAWNWDNEGTGRRACDVRKWARESSDGDGDGDGGGVRAQCFRVGFGCARGGVTCGPALGDADAA